MTDNEIIKECRKRGLENGSALGFHSGFMDIAADRLEELRSENNLQKAEIERLSKKCLKCGEKTTTTILHLQTIIAEKKAEIEQLTKDKENLAYSFANAVGQKMTAKAEAEVLLKYHPLKFYPVEISTPYGIFFCKKEEDYEEFKLKIQQDFIKYAKEYFKDSYFAYDAEQKCEELDDILKEMENTTYDD